MRRDHDLGHHRRGRNRRSGGPDPDTWAQTDSFGSKFSWFALNKETGVIESQKLNGTYGESRELFSQQHGFILTADGNLYWQNWNASFFHVARVGRPTTPGVVKNATF